MSCHFPRLCHDTCLIKYVVSDYHTRVSSGSSAKAGSAARIVSTVDCFLCRLNTTGLRTVCRNTCNGSSSCRRELSCLIYYTVNAARISAGSHTVHNNRTDCKLSFVALVSCLALNQCGKQCHVIHRSGHCRIRTVPALDTCADFAASAAAFAAAACSSSIVTASPSASSVVTYSALT